EVRRQSLIGSLTDRWIAAHRDTWESLVREDLDQRERALQWWAKETRELMNRLIQSFKARQLSPDEAVSRTRSLPNREPLRWAAEVYQEYQRALAREGLVDFDDM